MHKIDKGVPIPSKSKFPFADMGVGDSFFSTKRTVRTSAYQYGTTHYMEFTSRQEKSDEGELGFRVWRIK